MNPQPRVALFVTCLVDLYRPTVGFAALRLLERAGCQVEVPPGQTCCGQPAYNAGDRATARDLGRQMIEALSGYDYVVAPSGSCAGMLRVHLPRLFEDDPDLRPRAEGLAAKCWELTSFLVDVRGMTAVAARFEGVVAYHDSCSGLRELGVRAQPRALLGAVEGVRVAELAGRDACCGFGGLFAVKYPELSTRMAADKLADAAATDAPVLAGGDLGCLLNIAGRARREGRPLAVRHVAEILAGMTDAVPPIGEPG